MGININGWEVLSSSARVPGTNSTVDCKHCTPRRITEKNSIYTYVYVYLNKREKERVFDGAELNPHSRNSIFRPCVSFLSPRRSGRMYGQWKKHLCSARRLSFTISRADARVPVALNTRGRARLIRQCGNIRSSNVRRTFAVRSWKPGEKCQKLLLYPPIGWYSSPLLSSLLTESGFGLRTVSVNLGNHDSARLCSPFVSRDNLRDGEHSFRQITVTISLIGRSIKVLRLPEIDFREEIRCTCIRIHAPMILRLRRFITLFWHSPLLPLLAIFRKRTRLFRVLGIILSLRAG